MPRGEKTKTKTIEAEGKVDGANHKDEDADEEKDSAMQTEEEHLEEIRRAQKLRAKGELEKYKETIKLLRKDPTNKHLIDQRVYYEEKQKQRKEDDSMLHEFGTNPFNKALITKKKRYVMQRQRSSDFAEFALEREKRARAALLVQRNWRRRRRGAAQGVVPGGDGGGGFGGGGFGGGGGPPGASDGASENSSSSDGEDLQYDDYGELIIDANTGRPKLKDNGDIFEQNSGVVVRMFRAPVAWKNRGAETFKLVGDKRKIKERIKSMRRKSVASMSLADKAKAVGFTPGKTAGLDALGRRSVVTMARGESEPKDLDRVFQTGQTMQQKLRNRRGTRARPSCWVALSGSEFPVRSGPNFAHRRHMVPSRESLYEMESFDVYYSEAPVAHGYARMLPPDSTSDLNSESTTDATNDASGTFVASVAAGGTAARRRAGGRPGTGL